METEQAKLRARFRGAGKTQTDPGIAELLGFLGLEPLVLPPESSPDPKIRWCAQDDPWLDLIARRLADGLNELPAASVGRFLLGRRIETLARWALAHLAQARIIAHNLPVYVPIDQDPSHPTSSRRTIGELDLVYQGPGESVIRHRELAAKWYIFDPDTRHEGPACPDGFDAWWGPKRRDRLDLKLGRMCEHQIALGQHPAARALLGEQSPSLHEIWLHGQLFWPLHLPLDQIPSRIAPRINPRAICGRWARHRQWCQDQALHPGDGDWYVLDKTTWLRQYHPPQDATRCEVCPDKTWPHPQMLAYCSQDSPNAGLLEHRRVFVVPNDWGHDALAKARA